MLGAGRPRARPEIIGTRELTREEVLTTPRGATPAVKKYRDSHHRLARLFAMGLRPGEVAERAGYSPSRISVLRADPAFEELIQQYRSMVDDSFKEAADEYFEIASSNRIMAARLINDKLAAVDESGDLDSVSFGHLVSIHADAADRTGYPKRSVAVNVNLDFAAKLEAARRRSKAVQQIEPPLLELKARRI